ncbi:hypothetical protein CYMTET_52427, partial [Cymbomonas tetramitiformis]
SMRCSLAAAEKKQCTAGYDVRGCSMMNLNRKTDFCAQPGHPYDARLRPVIGCESWDTFVGNVYASRHMRVALELHNTGDDATMAERWRADKLRLRQATRSNATLDDEDGVEDVIILSAGSHDGAYSHLNEAETHRVIDRVAAVMAAQVQKAVPAQGDCVHEPANFMMEYPSCKQGGHQYLTSSRLQQVNKWVRAHIEQKWSAPGRRIEILDTFGISNPREDLTGHRDMVHYCPTMYSQFSQVLMNMLCKCPS